MLKNFEQIPLTIRKNKKLGEEPFVHPSAYLSKSRLGNWTEVGANSFIVESTIDDYSYDAGDVNIIYSNIGKFVSIASHVRINPGNHPMNRVTQHHITYRRRLFEIAEKDDTELFNWRRDNNCTIGHDVWIGHGATIMAGVSIATGAVIGAGAVVTKDIGPYEVAVGVPARVIKKRFPDLTIEKLIESRWWDWSREQLCKRFEDFYDMDTFIEKYC